MKEKKYSFSEIIKNGISLIYTKLFFKNARLIRLPVYIRGNRKQIKYKKGLTLGYRCRIELVGENRLNKITFGENCIIGDYAHIAAKEKIEIGNNVLMASKVFITDLNHGNYAGDNQSNPNIIPNKREIHSKPVFIGNNVWIGENVTILPGVKIANGAIIGANSVVTKDIEENCIVVGNPASVIKRFDEKSSKWIKI